MTRRASGLPVIGGGRRRGRRRDRRRRLHRCGSSSRGGGDGAGFDVGVILFVGGGSLLVVGGACLVVGGTFFVVGGAFFVVGGPCRVCVCACACATILQEKVGLNDEAHGLEGDAALAVELGGQQLAQEGGLGRRRSRRGRRLAAPRFVRIMRPVVVGVKLMLPRTIENKNGSSRKDKPHATNMANPLVAFEDKTIHILGKNTTNNGPQTTDE